VTPLEDRTLLSVTITDLGVVAPVALNDRGDVLGYSPGKYVIDSDGTMTELPSSYDAEYTELNNSGQAVGSCSPIGVYLGLVWTGGPSFKSLSPGYITSDAENHTVFVGLFHGASDALAINSKGDVVGLSEGYELDQNAVPISTFQRHATIWPSGQFDPTFLPIPGLSGANDINDAGQIVGWYSDATTDARAFVYRGGGLVNLPGLPGDPVDQTSNAKGVNARGDIIGIVGENGVLWKLDQNGSYEVVDLGVGHIPKAISAEDAILFTNSDLIWTPQSGVVKISNLVPATLGWRNLIAVNINESGQIVGTGRHNGASPSGFLLSGWSIPKVVPTALSFGSHGGADYGYKISDADLSQATTINLQWAKGKSMDTAIGDPITSVTTETAQGTYKLHASPAQLGTPPPGAKFLLVAIDPKNTVTSADPSKVASWTSNLSGLAWLQAAGVSPNPGNGKYPYSVLIKDLKPGFQENVQAFSDALKEAHAQTKIAATFRDKTRAYLMYWAWQIAHGTPASKATAMPGLDIRWDYGDESFSQQAAQEMVDFFKIVYQPASPEKNSRHVDRLAIDWKITWSGPLKIALGPLTTAWTKKNKYKAGQVITIIASGPQSSYTNETLWKVGETYGVIKLKSDKPHWSTDGS
jgi:probable HAF family extracellular repeat protein